MAGYNRVYINLVEESKRYAEDNKKIYGKCILEEKNNVGKIIVQVENLKQTDYYTYLLVSQHGQYIAVPFDKLNNKFQLKKEIANGYINNTKFLLKDVLAVMVGVKENDKLIPVLIGYKKDKINYKGNFYVYNKKSEKQKDVTPPNKKVDVKYKEIKKNDTEEKSDVINIPETKNLNTTHKSFEVEIDVNTTNEADKKSNEPYVETNTDKDKAKADDFFGELFSGDDDSSENLFSNILTRFKEEIDEIKYISEVSNDEFAKINNSILQVDLTNEHGDLNYIFEHNNKIKPYIKQNKNVEWVTIDLKELTVIDNKCWELRRNPFVMQGYGRYGHLILGKYAKDESDCYLIGIPSKYDENNITTAKEMGVIQYKPCDNKELLNSVPGYWIIFKN